MSPPPKRPPLPGGTRGAGAEKPPLFPPLAELRDMSFKVSRSGLLELFGRTRFGCVFGASGVSNFGAEFRGASAFGEGGGGWLALQLTGDVSYVFLALGAALAAFGLINAAAVARGAWFSSIESPRRMRVYVNNQTYTRH